jgi:aryl-alcohol dehydrogenase-like predicted oxidoreductase
MAISYVVSRPFTTAVIIGATKMWHLKTNIDAEQVRLSEEILSEIETIHGVYTYPCP